MEKDKNIIYTISKHASERYAERIMGRDGTWDVNKFILANQEKIDTDINKLIQYGELVFSGRQNKKDAKNSNAIVDVYIKDCWVIIANAQTKNVITLYKIDLGLDEDFNKAYVRKMVEKISEQKAFLDEISQEVEEETNMYRDLIEDAEVQIKNYKVMIKNLEELCIAYKGIIDNNGVKIAQASKNVTDVLNTLIGKKEF